MHTSGMFIATSALLATMSFAVSAGAFRPHQGNLKVGDSAPDFTLKDVDGQSTITLSKLRGKPVVLIFGSCT